MKIRRKMSRVNIRKGKVGKNVLGSYEKVSALVGYFGVIGSGKTTIAEGSYALLSAATDMAAFGISETANMLLYHHITEYFRISGKGAQLYKCPQTLPVRLFHCEAHDGSHHITSVQHHPYVFYICYKYALLPFHTHLQGLHFPMQ